MGSGYFSRRAFGMAMVTSIVLRFVGRRIWITLGNGLVCYVRCHLLGRYDLFISRMEFSRGPETISCSDRKGVIQTNSSPTRRLDFTHKRNNRINSTSSPLNERPKVKTANAIHPHQQQQQPSPPPFTKFPGPLRTRHITPPNMIHRRIQTLPAARAQQLDPIPRRRRARPAIVPLRRRRRRPGAGEEAARLLLVCVGLVLGMVAYVGKTAGRRGCAPGRHAHVQRLDRVGFGLAVGAVGDVAGAVGFDDFGFGEAWGTSVSTCRVLGLGGWGVSRGADFGGPGGCSRSR